MGGYVGTPSPCWRRGCEPTNCRGGALELRAIYTPRGGRGDGVCSQASSPPCLFPRAASGGQGSRGGSGVPWPPPQESLSMLMRA